MLYPDWMFYNFTIHFKMLIVNIGKILTSSFDNNDHSYSIFIISCDTTSSFTLIALSSSVLYPR